MSTTVQKTIEKLENQFPGNSIKVVGEHPASAFQRMKAGELEIANVPYILPDNHSQISSSIASFRENSFQRNKQEDLARYKRLIQKSVGIGATSEEEQKVASRELAAYRVFELTADVLASPWCMSAFQQINLSSDEIVMIKRPASFNLNGFTVRSVSLNGYAYQERWETTAQAEFILMEMLGTDGVRLPLRDLQRGDISQVDAADAKLKYDMTIKMDTLAKTNIDAAKQTSGLRALLNIHPSVVAANIPDTNYLDLSDAAYGTSGKITLPKIKAILSHISRFGSAGGADVPISIKNIMMSPQNIQDPWDFIDLVSGWDTSGESWGGPAVDNPLHVVPSAVRDQIFQTGAITNAWGHTFNWTPNSQLGAGKMYITTNQPLGWHFTKTEFDRMIRFDETNSKDHMMNDEVEFFYKKTSKFYVPDLWKNRILIVDL